MADNGNKRNIPIKLGDFSVIDTEFSSIRERFDSEMRKMEEEMAKFRSDLMNRESSFFETSFSSKKMATSSSTATSNATTSAKPHSQTQSASDISSPLIQDEGDNKVLKLRFDVSQYAPEEIVVKTVDNKLLVHAKHEEKSDTKSVYREYNREFLLPKGCNPELIKSSLSKDGVLTVDAPLPPQALTAGETMIPIAHN
ncbi:heat shock protein beta-1 isoform X1 [Anopheles aquasalis]|uniref:heat shock protein beta-1 isoform X1 n=1 Tax=Anopheles darlingi TaxID=43151 RepID=UPI0021005053|nr:heat shock protein beta-1 isoform X1 [Anopheles darlingi]XP_050099846.1 heat shock protein beta-1 isoform X1 [Anopheles aquasalis]